MYYDFFSIWLLLKLKKEFIISCNIKLITSCSSFHPFTFTFSFIFAPVKSKPAFIFLHSILFSHSKKKFSQSLSCFIQTISMQHKDSHRAFSWAGGWGGMEGEGLGVMARCKKSSRKCIFSVHIYVCLKCIQLSERLKC